MARVKSTDGEAKAVKSSEASQKLQAIKVAMEQIDKQYGTGSIMRLGEKASATQIDRPHGSRHCRWWIEPWHSWLQSGSNPVF